MRDNSPKSSPDRFNRKRRTTFGEVLKDGTVIELVIQEDRLMLCIFDGQTLNILPSYRAEDAVYTSPVVDPSLRASVRFPPPPAEYDSLAATMNKAVKVFEARRYPSNICRLSALIAAASWSPESLFEPLTVVVHGSDMQDVAIWFSLVASMSRRPFIGAQLSRALPFGLQPTLFILAPDSSPERCAFWRAANMRGVRVPSAGGAVANFSGVRVLFADDQQTLAAWGPEVMPVLLLPCPPLTPPAESELTNIANYFQSRFLMWRLRQLANVSQPPTTPKTPKQAADDRIFRQLWTLFGSDQEISKAVAPILRERQRALQERRRIDPACLLVEALWMSAHKSKEMRALDLLDRLNTLLRNRGESVVFNSWKLGRKLAQLGFQRCRDRKGRFLFFSADFRRQLHLLKRRFQLELPTVENCPECQGNSGTA